MARLRRHLPLIVVTAAVLLVALPVLTYPLGRDQGEFAVIARGMLVGKAPYSDLWNPKPPAVFFVYAAAMSLFGQTAPALRAIDFVIVPLVMLCLYWIVSLTPNPSPSRRGAFNTALFTPLLFGVFYFSETFWTLTQNDGIAILPMCLAVVCALKAGEGTRRAWLWALAAGACMGVVFWFKYPFALFGVVVVVAYVWAARETDTARRVPTTANVGTGRAPSALINHLARVVLAFAFGGILILLLGTLWLWSIGAWDAFLESIRVTASYTALGADSATFGEAASIALSMRWAQWGVLFGLAAVGVWVLRRSPVRWLAWTWLLATFAIMLVQLRGYDYHWLPMLPALALFGGAGIEGIVKRGKLKVKREDAANAVGMRYSASEVRTRHAVSLLSPFNVYLLTFPLLLAILALSIYPRALPYLTGQEDRLSYYDRFVAGEFVAGESQRVADWLSGRVVRGDSLYIWGFRPEIYYLSGLNPPTRFIFQFPLVADWYPKEWREQNVEVLWAALPPYTLVAQVDYMPWVTGSEEDSNTLLQAYTELNDWLIYNYERETQIGNLFIWHRRS